MYDGSINIDTRIDTKGINKGTRSITNSLSGILRATKAVFIALGAVFSATAIFRFVTDAVKAFDYMSSFAGQSIRDIQDAWKQLQGAAANLGLTILTALTPYIIAAVNWLTKMLSTITAIVAALFGVNTAMQGVTQSTEEAGKKAGNSLAAFDQINVLNKKDDNKTPAAQLPIIPTISPDFLKSIEKFKAEFIKFFKPLTDAFSALIASPLWKTIGDIFKWLWDNVLAPFGTWLVQSFWPALVNVFTAVSNVIDAALVALKPLWDWLWENVLKPAAEYVGDAILNFLDWLAEKLNSLAEWIRDNPEKFETFVKVLGGVAIALGLLLLPIASVEFALLALGVIIALLIAYWPQISEAARKAWDWIKATWETVSTWFKTKVIDPIVNFFKPAWEFISILAHDAWALIAYQWENAKVLFKGITDFIKNVFKLLWDDAVARFNTAFGIFKVIGDQFTAFFDTGVGKVIKKIFFDTLDAVYDKWKIIFDMIIGIAKGSINNIIGFINGMINAIVGGINAIINGANAVGSVVPDWIAIPTVTAPQIPYLAKGAVIPPNSQFLAVLGDQRSGTNIETPESLMRQVFREEAANMGSPQNINVTFGGTMSELIRVMKPHIDRENRRVGTSLIASGNV